MGPLDFKVGLLLYNGKKKGGGNMGRPPLVGPV